MHVYTHTNTDTETQTHTHAHTCTHLVNTCIYIDLVIFHCAGRLTSELKNFFLYKKVGINQ